MKLSQDEEIIENALCQKLLSVKPLSGGCINECFVYKMDKGAFFVKLNKRESLAMFEAEVQGLDSLRATKTIRIPKTYCCGSLPEGGAYLIMEYIVPGKMKSWTQKRFGEDLASLHLAEGASRFGFVCDNTIGSTSQKNSWNTSWVDFFLLNRLQEQLDLADKTNGDETLRDYGKKVLKIVPKLFEGISIKPSLIHGDLWSGNMLVDEEGRVAIVDPAAYYGHHEAEFGMMEMFGGGSLEFYEAYHQKIPKQEGFEERQLVYKLYHILNHLNLFGRGYYSSCLSIMKSLLGKESFL